MLHIYIYDLISEIIGVFSLALTAFSPLVGAIDVWICCHVCSDLCLECLPVPRLTGDLLVCDAKFWRRAGHAFALLQEQVLPDPLAS